MNVTMYNIAQRYVGIQEIPGKQDNPTILSMLRLDGDWPKNDEVPWCSAFLNYCAWLLRLPRSKSLAARSWLGVGTPIDIDEADPAFDVVVLWREKKDGPFGHVGLFAGLEAQRVLLLGGNQGGSVNISSYPVARVLGVRRLLQE